MYSIAWNYFQTWWFWVSLIPLVFGFGFGISMARATWGDFTDILMGSFFGFIGSLVLFFVGVGFWGLVLPHHDYTTRQELAILRDGSTTSGSVVLGSGYLKDDPAMSFYSRADGFNRYQIVRTNNNTRIYEDLQPGQIPWLVTLDDCALWGKVATCFVAHRVITEVHVPPNTIKPTLELDAR